MEMQSVAIGGSLPNADIDPTYAVAHLFDAILQLGLEAFLGMFLIVVGEGAEISPSSRLSWTTPTVRAPRPFSGLSPRWCVWIPPCLERPASARSGAPQDRGRSFIHDEKEPERTTVMIHSDSLNTIRGTHRIYPKRRGCFFIDSGFHQPIAV